MNNIGNSITMGNIQNECMCMYIYDCKCNESMIVLHEYACEVNRFYFKKKEFSQTIVGFSVKIKSFIKKISFFP